MDKSDLPIKTAADAVEQIDGILKDPKKWAAFVKESKEFEARGCVSVETHQYLQELEKKGLL